MRTAQALRRYVYVCSAASHRHTLTDIIGYVCYTKAAVHKCSAAKFTLSVSISAKHKQMHRHSISCSHSGATMLCFLWLVPLRHLLRYSLSKKSTWTLYIQSEIDKPWFSLLQSLSNEFFNIFIHNIIYPSAILQPHCMLDSSPTYLEQLKLWMLMGQWAVDSTRWKLLYQLCCVSYMNWSTKSGSLWHGISHVIMWSSSSTPFSPFSSSSIPSSLAPSARSLASRSSNFCCTFANWVSSHGMNALSHCELNVPLIALPLRSSNL